jgi:protein arginine kinase
LNLGILRGVKHAEVTALLYRIQDAHLNFVVKTANVQLEEDITGDEKKMERLRAIVIQEAFSGIEIIHG